MGTCTTGGASGGLAGACLKKKPETKNRQTSDNIPIASHTEILTLPTLLKSKSRFTEIKLLYPLPLRHLVIRMAS
jgi:hypothetical protein